MKFDLSPANDEIDHSEIAEVSGVSSLIGIRPVSGEVGMVVRVSRFWQTPVIKSARPSLWKAGRWIVQWRGAGLPFLDVNPGCVDDQQAVIVLL